MIYKGDSKQRWRKRQKQYRQQHKEWQRQNREWRNRHSFLCLKTDTPDPSFIYAFCKKAFTKKKLIIVIPCILGGMGIMLYFFFFNVVR